MGRKTVIGITIALSLAACSLIAYSSYIGFERKSLADKLPADTWAFIEVRHFKKAFISFIRNEELHAATNIAKAISYSISGRTPEPSEEEPTQVEPELWNELSKFIKTRIAIALLSPPNERDKTPAAILVAHFYGSKQSFEDTLNKFASQASTEDVSLEWRQFESSETPYQTLISPTASQSRYPEVSWAIHKEILYLASSQSALKRILAHIASPDSPSLASQITLHQAEKHIGRSDIAFYLEAKQSLDYFSQIAAERTFEIGGFNLNLNPSEALSELGLYNFDSLFGSLSLTGDQETYSSLTYTDQPRILSALRASDDSLLLQPPDISCYASDNLNLDAGELLITLKDSFLKAAPLANFAYMFVHSDIQKETGQSLDELLTQGVGNNLSTFQTLDIGTTRLFSGETKQIVVHDSAIKIELGENNIPLINLIKSQFPKIQKSLYPRAYLEDGVFYIDQFEDRTLTSGRIAIHHSPSHLTIGFGTLKAFKTLVSRKELYTPKPPLVPNPPTQVGNGNLLLSSLPATLYELATIFYQQLNPGKSIPIEFLEFDWRTLSILEQERESRLYHDPNGRLYRVSKKRR
ncbi:hypothetical protein [Pelagicoccus mobilis]|uniref:DUF3352 domain-containing protein n=1 Tax=Pelagicoccus mobilis TaxID=415221 RepID=A0A934RZJ4_9BACT|nr:hypothetical protein [Pelagicoccus mobilis]MBK1880555.1 hypothetical protein [Pelagicoccus mobilis]